jgi:glycosyltransferase involved in cell wall biosynthesis
MKKTILFVTYQLDIGGIEKSLISLLNSIDYSKYKVDLLIVSPNKGLLIDMVNPNVNIKNPDNYFEWVLIPKNTIHKAIIQSFGSNTNIFKVIYYLFQGLLIKNMGISRQRLWRACKNSFNSFDGEYDVAIDYSGGLKAFILDKVIAKKKLTWIHSDYRVYKRDKKIDYEDYKKLDSIITVSKTAYDIFVSEFPTLQEKTHVIQNITNKNQIQEMAKEKIDFDNNYEGIKILDITRLDPNKGLEIAVESCKYLLEEGYNIKWYILGDGPEKHKLEELIKFHKLEDRFILLGLHANPYPYIKRADLIVHCSLFEGKSVAIDEAMLLAKPIILTDYPTAKDQITHKKNGLICDISVNGVSDAIIELVNNEALRAKLVSNLLEFDLPSKESTEKLYKIINE